MIKGSGRRTEIRGVEWPPAGGGLRLQLQYRGTRASRLQQEAVSAHVSPSLPRENADPGGYKFQFFQRLTKVPDFYVKFPNIQSNLQALTHNPSAS